MKLFDTWTDNRIHWDAALDTFAWGFTNVEVTIKSIPPDPVYLNGKRLKPGQCRPVPFWVKQIKTYNETYNEPIKKLFIGFVIRLCGAYSRHYDQVRKFRKKRLF